MKIYKLMSWLILCLAIISITAIAQDKPPEQQELKQFGIQRSGTVAVPRGKPGAVPWTTEEEKQAYARSQLEFLKNRVDYSDHHPERRPMPDPTPADPFSISKNGVESNPAIRAPSNITLIRNTSVTPVVPNGFSSVVGEPSVAASTSQVLYTSNWFAARSSNSGDTFTHLDPFTGPFPPVNGGFCCDQQAEYDAVNDTLFMQQQYISDANGNAQRINVDQNADGSFECFFDVTPGSIGFTSNALLDFPDLAIGSQFLYLSTNSFRPQGQSFTFEGAAVIRFPLTELAACAGTVNAQLHTETSFGSFRFAHGATDPMYFADHVSLSTVRIWSWATGQSSPSSVDRSVASWTNNNRVCTDPGGFNPCDFLDSRILGGYAANGVVGFMWVPSQDGTFSYPYTRVSRFDATSNLSHIDDQDIFSNDFAYIYPSAAASGNGDVGGTIMAAGGTQALECLAYVSDASNGNVFAPLDYVSVIQGVNGPNNDRTGDYLTAREFPGDPDQWVASCFAFTSPTQPDSRFVQFERDAGGPGNQPPTASFTFNCTDLACSFDGSGSSDSDGTIVSYAWAFGDGGTGSGVTTNHTYGGSGTFNVTLTVTDDGGATDNQSQNVTVTAPSNITLSAQPSGSTRVILTWSGANGTRVDIYRNGSFLRRTRNDGSYRDRPGSGTWTYQICEQNSTTVCSNTDTVTL